MTSYRPRDHGFDGLVADVIRHLDMELAAWRSGPPLVRYRYRADDGCEWVSAWCPNDLEALRNLADTVDRHPLGHHDDDLDTVRSRASSAAPSG